MGSQGVQSKAILITGHGGLLGCDMLRTDRLCGLVVRVLDYRYSGPGFDSRALQKKVVGLEWGPLSLVSTTEELLDRKQRPLSRKPRIRP
jgi:hypothetical protein